MTRSYSSYIPTHLLSPGDGEDQNTSTRMQFGQPLKGFPLLRHLISRLFAAKTQVSNSKTLPINAQSVAIQPSSATSLYMGRTPSPARTPHCGTMLEWDTSAWKQVRHLLAGTPIASASSDSQVGLWRLLDLRTFTTFRRLALWVSCVPFSMDGRRVLCGGQDKIISEWTAPPKNALLDKPASTARVYRSKISAINTKSVAIRPSHILSSACGTIFANRSKAKLEALLWEDALLDAQKVATGIDACALVAFQPGIRDAREKLQWASARVTTLREDPAYSLFVIFGVRLPILYGENKQHALGRLLQEIVAQSGDVTALDWVGPPSEFNSCLPADISSYAAPPRTLPYLSEDEIRTAVSSLRHTVAVDQISKFYDQLDNMGAPHFVNCRLRLSCIIFPVTEVRRSLCPATETFLTYGVKADGLRDLEITTEEKLIQFSRLRPTRRTFLLVRPWDRRLLGELTDLESHSRALRVIAHLGQPFGALLLAQQRGGEYKRIASDRDIVAQVKDMTSVANMMDIRTLEIM